MALIPLNKNNYEQILVWRNSPRVRNAMFHSQEISLEEHREWFKKLQQSDDRQWFIFQDNKGVAQGVVSFIDINEIHKTAFWGFYTRPEALPGMGTRLAIEAIDNAFGRLKLVKLNAEVREDNQKSRLFHKKIGFKNEGVFRSQFFNGFNRIDVFRFGMLSEEWAANKLRLVGGR